jgi:hypothetical protein
MSSFEEILGIESDPALHPDEDAGPAKFLGVTRILRESSAMPAWEVANDILERGSEVHRACDLLDSKPRSFRWSSFPSEWHGYIHAWLTIKEDFGVEVLASERHVENKSRCVRGRLDRILKVRGQKHPMVAELCTGPIQQFKALQMSAYGDMWKHGRGFHRVGFQLKKDGTYALREFPINTYFRHVQDFWALAAAIHVRRRHEL